MAALGSCILFYIVYSLNKARFPYKTTFCEMYHTIHQTLIMAFYGLAPDMGAYEYESEYDFNLGDVNFDNEINVLDVVLMVSFILGEPTDEYEYSAADINQDGLLNILDIVALINIILRN